MSRRARPVPHWRERQIAARAAAQEESSHVRIGLLLDLQGDDAKEEPPVGYALPATDTLKMREHICTECAGPRIATSAYVPVYAPMLAAKMPCTRCGRRLETL